MQLNSFRVNKFRTLDIPSIQFSHRDDKLTKSTHEAPSLRQQIKLRLEFIRDRSAHGQVRSSNRNKSLSQQKQAGSIQQQGNNFHSKQSLKLGSYKDEDHKTNSYSSRQNSRDKKPTNKFIAELKRKRMRFIEQYGYIMEKPKKIELEKQKMESIDILPNIEDTNQRLFLSEVEEMKVQKTIEEFRPSPNKSIKKTKKQLERLNKAVRKVEQEVSINDSAQKQRQSFSKVRRAHSQVDAKIFLKNLNVQKLTNSLILYSNRLYGKGHPSQSAQWCAEVMKAQIQSQYGSLVSRDGQKVKKKVDLHKTVRTKILLKQLPI